MDPSSPRQEEKLEVAVRAAWLYYVAGNTQHEIAQKLHISRPTAQRLVALAMERGLVKVRVNHKVASCLELAIALRQRYNLVVCNVVPVNADTGDQILRKIAIAGDGASNPYDAALQFAEKIGSKCFLLPAPLLADSSEERKQWCRHRLYKVVEELSNQADVAFVGIGDMRLGCPMHRDGFITKEEVRELVKAGAVGDNLGWTFSQMGELVRISIQARGTTIQLRSS